MLRSFLWVIFVFLAGCTTPSIVATQAIQRGDAANNQNNYPEAIKNYEQYLSLSPQLGLYRNPQMETAVMRKLAHAYSTQGRYKQAIGQLNKALMVDSVNNYALSLLEDFRQLGMVYGYSGNFFSAKKYLEKSLSLNEGLENSLKENKRSAAAGIYLSLAQLDMTLGNFKESKNYAWQAWNIYSKIPEEAEGTIEALLIIGIIERETGQLNQAEKYIKQSQELSSNNHFSIGRHAQALSEIYFLKGDPENGIRQMLRAVEEAEKTNIKPQIMNAYIRMGDGYQRMGDQSKANFYYRKAAAIQEEQKGDTLSSSQLLNLRMGDIQKAYNYYQQSGSSIGMAAVNLRLGEQYVQKNKLDSSLYFFEQAKSSYAKTGSVEGLSKACLELGKVYITMQQFEPAKKLLNESFQQTKQPDFQWQIFLGKGRISEGLRLYDSALYWYKKSIETINEMRGNIFIEEFKTLFTNTKVEAYDRIILLLLNHHKEMSGYSNQTAVEESFSYNEQSRSRTFLDMLGNQKIKSKNTNDEALLEREQLLKLKIQQLSKELNSGKDDALRRQLSNELSKAENEYDNLIRQIKLNNAAYSTVISVEPPSTRDIQSKLDASSVIIEYWMSHESLVIWTLSKTNISATIVPVSRKTLHREIVGSRNAIAMQVPDLVDKGLSQLNEYLIKPVEQQIQAYKNLIIVPHKDLHFLPFQALEIKPRQFLVERYDVNYSPSASILYYCLNKKVSSGKRILSLALGDYPIGNFPGLPGTEVEINQLKELYPEIDLKVGQAFSETFLKNNISNQNYIHFATHGVLNKNQPLHSYLLMAPTEQDDGRLTVDEIFSLDIQSRFVTLSACETALGDIGEGDDLVGLSRAFIYAGTPGVIVSLWKVDDSSTAWLMTRFHQYINKGNSAIEALSLAQRDLIQRNFSPTGNRGLENITLAESLKQVTINRNNSSSRNPYYWAPFIIIGNGFIRD